MSSDDLPVRFIPPLAHERQRWIMETLRLNRARSVIDIGCGEGSLLNALCGFASSVPDDPPDSQLSTPIQDLFLGRVAGLDIDPGVLDDAVAAATVDREPHYLAPWGSGEDGWYIRWAPLETSVWRGGLEVFNPEFCGFDAIVSTEVIEHVPESILPAFSGMLLGRYRPRLMILTTPNYTFNARFHPPDVPRKGFLDPTGETDRVFRHSDHKREWTVPEFTDWCRTAADAHGYDVVLDGVGVPTVPDPFGRELGYASQTAVFTRREPVPEAEEVLWPGATHTLLARRAFSVDSRAGCPRSAREIRETLAWVMRMRGEGELTFGELWAELAMPCGGSVAALVDALMEPSAEDDTAGQWSILPPTNPNHYTQPRWDRVVVWSGFERPVYDQAEEHHEEMEYTSDGSLRDVTESKDSDAIGCAATYESSGWGVSSGWGEDTDGVNAWG